MLFYVLFIELILITTYCKYSGLGKIMINFGKKFFTNE